MIEKMLISGLIIGSITFYAQDYVTLKEETCSVVKTYNENYIREAQQWSVYAPEIRVEYNPIENGDLDERCK